MKNLIIGLSLLLPTHVFGINDPINLKFIADDLSVENVSLPKTIDLDNLEVSDELFKAIVKFNGKVDGRKLELNIPLKKISEDSKFFYVRAIVISEHAAEEVCGEAWQRDLILDFRITRNGDWSSDYKFQGRYAHTFDNCHSPFEVRLFKYNELN
jgi:hypothetical protein